MGAVTDTKDFVWEDVRKRRRHSLVWALYTILILSALIYLTPIAWKFANEGFTRSTTAEAIDYLTTAVFRPLGALHLQWSIMLYEARSGWPPVWHMSAIALALAVFGIFGRWLNPHPNIPWIHGKARWANDDTIREMEKREQVGIDGGRYVPLGRWSGGKNKNGKYRLGEYVRLIETLSIFVPAPPGARKTVAVVVPAIVTADNCSQIIHDCKPELWEITSGWAAQNGVAIQLAWGALDDPATGKFHARFNFISKKVLPPKGDPRLNTIIDALVQIIIQDKPNNPNNYFDLKGRSALAGFIYFLISKVNHRGDYTGIPARWHGMEASLPMLADWVAEAQFRAGQKIRKKKESAQNLDEYMRAGGQDPMAEWLTELAEEADQNGYERRAFLEMSTLASMADKERSGVLGTMDAALIVFKNPAVAERTSGCDFSVNDLRGIKDPTNGTIKPLKVYLYVNQAETKAFAVVTALFCEVASRALLSQEPGQTAPDGTKLGPYPVSFILDEFPKLAKCTAVMEGPDLGRSKKVSYLMICQDLAQIEEVYGRHALETLMSTSAVKIWLPQNNDKTAKRAVEMVGKTTIRKQSRSHQSGMTKDRFNLSSNVSESFDGVPLLTEADFTSMTPGTQIVMVQNFMSEPLYLESPIYYQDPETKDRCYNPRADSGPRAAPPIPEWMRSARAAEWQLHQSNIRQLHSAIPAAPARAPANTP